MYAAIGDPREAEDLYRRTLTEKEKMLMEDSMLGMDESMCKYHAKMLRTLSLYCYRPHPKDKKANVFTGVC